MGELQPSGFEGGQFEVDQVRAYCLIRQHLNDLSKGSDVVEVSDDICGLHATSTVTPYLSLFNRMKKFDTAMLDSELGERGRLVRIRAVRGTLFIVPRSRLTLIRNALGTPEEPTKKWYSLRRMRREEFFELKSLIVGALKGRSISIQEIKKAVPKSRIRTISFRASKSVVRSATNVTWVVNWLVATGVVLSQKVGGLHAALRTKRPASDIESLPNRYALSEDLLGKIPHIPHSEAQRKFVRWYLENYSPTTVEDIAWWTGLPELIIRTVVSHFRDLARIRVKGLGYMIVPEGRLGALVNAAFQHTQISLLPYEDPFLKGYKLRGRFGPSKLTGRVYRGGSAAPSIVENGRIVATWRFYTGREGTILRIQTLEPIEGEVRETVLDRARNLTDFLFPNSEKQVIFR